MCILGILNKVDGSSDETVSNGRVTVNDELTGIWKEAVDRRKPRT